MLPRLQGEHYSIAHILRLASVPRGTAGTDQQQSSNLLTVRAGLPQVLQSFSNSHHTLQLSIVLLYTWCLMSSLAARFSLESVVYRLTPAGPVYYYVTGTDSGQSEEGKPLKLGTTWQLIASDQS